MMLSILLLNLAFGLFFQNYVLKQEDSQINTVKEGLSSYVIDRNTKYVGSVNDWGHWDDTYGFLDNNNAEYIEVNLSEATFVNLDLSFIILTDRDRFIQFKRFYSVENGTFTGFPVEFLAQIDRISDGSILNEGSSGILEIGDALYFVASTGVVDSLEQKPANGFMIIGRLIDSRIVKDMESITGCKVSSIGIVQDSQEQPASGPAIRNKKLAADQRAIDITLALPNGSNLRSSVVFQLNMSRDLYLSGMKNAIRFFITNTIAGILISVAIIILIGRYLTRPFEKLTEEVGSIDFAQSEFTRLPEEGQKEFLFLRRSINRLLKRIESGREEISQSKEKLQATLVSVGDGVITVDKNGAVEFMNPEAQRLTGWKVDAAAGLPIETVFNIVNELTRERVESPVKSVFETGRIITLSNDTMLISKDGMEVPIEDSAAPIKDARGVTLGCVLVFRDFSERKEKQRRIEYLSYHDQLTGLYNRRFFEEEMKRLDVRRNLPLTTVYADVNGLKMINDAFGHELGDRLIVHVAEAFKKECRADEIIARLGGDEFIILLPKTDASSAEKLVDRIRERIAKTKINDIDISISFGWDTKTDVGQSIDEILKGAESLMYQRKILSSNSKRNGVIQSILKILLLKSPREEAHSLRVSKLCECIGRAFNLNEDDVKELSIAGELHDIGKISIDEVILNKRRGLTEEEWTQIKHHPETGYRLLGATSEFYKLAEYVLAHHERWDGKGYPRGLKAEAINWKARAIAVADAYDAMTCQRPYRRALSKSEAVEEMQRVAGTQLDPLIVKVFVEKVLQSFDV
jgi:diguanylate cyclase (GGDEF)-like protein/PAS domain S-box-containing protein